ncbi:glyoxalase [Bizionia gelidisalsuginis]|uniref:Glyoxalase n=1 Tax=Bizionia gelidisalsuginis TaxID=291188 RepID=A0ABY3MB97_9FLAO|nr:glyoxalase [Bizionia gelidisalsuginis]TYC14087.1 glyoxalase [Bizionia gelidisalsuginis]
MSTRKEQLLAIRPVISSIKITKNMSSGERFQNETLRPIIKLQSELFTEVFRNYIAKHKNVFYELTLEKRLHYIENALQKDMKLRNALKGIVIGLFTVEEYANYIKNSSALNKRLINIVRERLQSNIQLFEKSQTLSAV